MAVELNYVRAAFIAYEPGGYPDRRRVIPFRVNPESLSRTVAAEGGQRPAGVESGRGATPPASGEAPADAAAAAVKHSFTVQIRLDFADRDPALTNLDEQYGIAPDIAAVEDLMYPAQTDADASSDGTEAVRAASPRPTVLLVWGRKRVLPVRITALKIEESVFNTELHPVRAELEASLEVLGEAEAQADLAVRSALDDLGARRRELARMYYDNTAAQGSNILPL
ncbi:hypothetical protein [Actinomadura sp. 21ATH]|uniref:hypothetical protein n=1 Tax=Actinomadura sp. 21ATH TaxID=1735444 RepID=UPI0035C079AF